MVGEATSHRAARGQDQEASDRGRTGPLSLCRDERGEARLPVECREHRLDIRDDRLHLDHEERPGWRMPGQNVDRAALAVAGERHLDRRVPPPCTEHLDSPLDERGMRRVEESVERLSPPREDDVHLHPERTGEAHEGIDPQAAGLAKLDPRDGLPRDARGHSHPLLRPAAPHAKRPERAADSPGPSREHRREGSPGAGLRLLRRSSPPPTTAAQGPRPTPRRPPADTPRRTLTGVPQNPPEVHR